MKFTFSKERITKLIVNKYFIVIVVFGVFVTFFDEHSLISRWQGRQKIKEMEQEVKYYQNEIQTSKNKMNELQSNDDNLEKFAREHYLMKRKDEDIYIIKE
jgi:cell division protein DivIC